MENELLSVEEKIVRLLKTVYDPEIPVNVYDLGLIYKVDVDDDNNVKIEMTLTAPNCPAADFIVEDIRMKIESIDEVKNVDVQLVFEPEWDKDMMSEEAKLELDFWYEYKTVVPRGFARFFGKIAELTDNGVEVHWFIGNHDIWIFDYLPDELGIILHKEALVCTLAGKRLFLAHGDVLPGVRLPFSMVVPQPLQFVGRGL